MKNFKQQCNNFLAYYKKYKTIMLYWTPSIIFTNIQDEIAPIKVCFWCRTLSNSKTINRCKIMFYISVPIFITEIKFLRNTEKITISDNVSQIKLSKIKYQNDYGLYTSILNFFPLNQIISNCYKDSNSQIL